MRPSTALNLKRSAVREAAGRFRTANPRVFGSALHGADSEGSDLDVLVDPLPGATLFDLQVCRKAPPAAPQFPHALCSSAANSRP